MVIPLGDHNPTRRTPFVTWVLLAVNLAIWLFLTPWGGDPCEQQQFFLRWATIPAELAQGHALTAEQVAASSGAGCSLSAIPDKNVYAAVLYSMFLHASWIHVLGNLLYLGIFGNNVEDRFGHLRFIGFYLLGGAIATVGFALPNLSTVQSLVGASGAIAAVLGSYLVLYPRARVTVAVPFLLFVIVQLPALFVLGLWFVLEVVQAQLGTMAGTSVAYLAHVAGFVAGVVLTLLLGGRPQPVPRRVA